MHDLITDYPAIFSTSFLEMHFFSGEKKLGALAAGALVGMARRQAQMNGCSLEKAQKNSRKKRIQCQSQIERQIPAEAFPRNQ